MKQPDPAHLYQILRADPVWAAYALADLQPAFAPYCQWQIGESADGESVVLLFTMLEPPIVFTMGPVPAVRAALQAMTLPEQIYLTIPSDHLPLLREFYEFGDHAHPMQRMVLRDLARYPVPIPATLTRLGMDDGERLRALYAVGGEFAPDYFDPYQLRDGVYFGVNGADGSLIAAGGTHILDNANRIAALGNMYTRSDQRGQGYGQAIVQAIVSTLLADGFTTQFLNVNPHNHGAHRIYQRCGFEDYCVFVEGQGIRR